MCHGYRRSGGGGDGTTSWSINLCENLSCEGMGGTLHTDEELFFVVGSVLIGGIVIVIGGMRSVHRCHVVQDGPQNALAESIVPVMEIWKYGNIE